MNKWQFWLGVMVTGAVLVWTAAMGIHGAFAADNSTAPEDKEPGPKWKIVLVLDGPEGHREFIYGDPTHGAHWYVTPEECEKARKGDKDLAKMLANVQVMIKKEHLQVKATLECRTDDSV